MSFLVYIFVIYLVIINMLAFIVTRYDKIASKAGARRVNENALILIGLMGGSPAMYITMKLIHHKTRNSLFMVGLPLIFVVEGLLVVFLSYSSHLFS